MDKLIQHLASARKVEAEYKQELNELQSEIKERYGSALGRARSLLDVARADMADAREKVVGRALKLFDEVGPGRVHPAVTIEMFARIGKEPRPITTISRDLSAYLEANDGPDNS